MAAPNERRSVPAESRRRITERIEREVGLPGLATILSTRLSPTDLQSLLLDVYARRVRARTPATLLQDYRDNRFVRPSRTSAALLSGWDATALSLLPEGFDAVDLSPVAPLGAVAALAPLSQDWSVSTSRNTEVVSDSTNALALEAAARRAEVLAKDSSDPTRVDLAASHRLLRGQRFAEGPGVRQHFRLFALCSAGRDARGRQFASEVAPLHIGFYLRTLRRHLGPKAALRVGVADLGDGARRASLEAGVLGAVAAQDPDAAVEWEDATPAGQAYYRDLRFHVYARDRAGAWVELADGGCVDWSQKLLNNRKERMLTSGIGSERLVQRFATDDDGGRVDRAK
jgi:hypothetical protein